MRNEYFKVIEELLKEVEATQSENISKAGELIAAECSGSAARRLTPRRLSKHRKGGPMFGPPFLY